MPQTLQPSQNNAAVLQELELEAKDIKEELKKCQNCLASIIREIKQEENTFNLYQRKTDPESIQRAEGSRRELIYLKLRHKEEEQKIRKLEETLYQISKKILDITSTQKKVFALEPSPVNVRLGKELWDGFLQGCPSRSNRLFRLLIDFKPLIARIKKHKVHTAAKNSTDNEIDIRFDKNNIVENLYCVITWLGKCKTFDEEDLDPRLLINTLLEYAKLGHVISAINRHDNQAKCAVLEITLFKMLYDAFVSLPILKDESVTTNELIEEIRKCDKECEVVTEKYSTSPENESVTILLKSMAAYFHCKLIELNKVKNYRSAHQLLHVTKKTFAGVTHPLVAMIRTKMSNYLQNYLLANSTLKENSGHKFEYTSDSDSSSDSELNSDQKTIWDDDEKKIECKSAPREYSFDKESLTKFTQLIIDATDNCIQWLEGVDFSSAIDMATVIERVNDAAKLSQLLASIDRKHITEDLRNRLDGINAKLTCYLRLQDKKNMKAHDAKTKPFKKKSSNKRREIAYEAYYFINKRMWMFTKAGKNYIRFFNLIKSRAALISPDDAKLKLLFQDYSKIRSNAQKLIDMIWERFGVCIVLLNKQYKIEKLPKNTEGKIIFVQQSEQGYQLLQPARGRFVNKIMEKLLQNSSEDNIEVDGPQIHKCDEHRKKRAKGAFDIDFSAHQCLEYTTSIFLHLLPIASLCYWK